MQRVEQWELVLAERRWRFVRRRPIDLLAVLLPALRPLRLVAALALVHRQSGPRLRGHVTQLVALASAIVTLVSTPSVLSVARDADGATINTFADSLWWAFDTITTVGYGDLAPVTAEGWVQRQVAALREELAGSRGGERQ